MESNDEKKLIALESIDIARETEKNRIKQLIFEMIPFGDIKYAENCISMQDLNKLMEKIG